MFVLFEFVGVKASRFIVVDVADVVCCVFISAVFILLFTRLFLFGVGWLNGGGNMSKFRGGEARPSGKEDARMRLLLFVAIASVFVSVRGAFKRDGFTRDGVFSVFF